MFLLTDGQSAVIEGVMNVIHDKDLDNRFMTVIGPAGSGKTTVVNDIIDRIPKYMKIGLTSPTHKATKVSRAMAIEKGIESRVDCRTIHSALGLTLKQVDGEEILVNESYVPEQKYDVLFIDESSMLSDELLGYILDCESKKVVFVGDKCQISPVGSESGEISKVFTEVDNVFELTEVVRQAADNPIISLATSLRESQTDVYSSIPSITKNLDDDEFGIDTMGHMDWIGDLITKFKSEEFKKDPDHCRAVAFTNNQVASINNFVRRKIFGDNVEEWRVGEIIVAQESGPGDFSWKNSEEMRIISVEDYWCNSYEVDCWLVKMDSLYTDNIYTAKIVKSDYKSQYDARLQGIAGKARTDSANRRTLWKKFWAMKNEFSEFKHIYAMTAHKSQGSTFDYTYVMTQDFLRFGESMEIKQLLYTSTTRSRYKTIFSC